MSNVTIPNPNESSDAFVSEGIQIVRANYNIPLSHGLSPIPNLGLALNLITLRGYHLTLFLYWVE